MSTKEHRHHMRVGITFAPDCAECQAMREAEAHQLEARPTPKPKDRRRRSEQEAGRKRPQTRHRARRRRERADDKALAHREARESE